MSRNAESTAFRSALEVIRGVEPRVADAIGAELPRPARVAQADRQRELRLPGRPCWPWATGSATSTPRAPSAAASTPAAATSTPSRRSPPSTPGSCSAPRHAYVQPHSGIDANLVAFWAVLADRVEAPALEKAGVRQVNDLTEADWAALRREPWQPADARHVAGRRRPPHPRLPAEHLRQDVRPAQLRHRPGDRPDRLRRACAEAAREFKPLIIVARLLGVPPAGELPDHAGDRRRGRRDASWSTWRTSPAWSPARSSPATSTRCRTPTSSPPPPTSRCAARAAAWCSATPQLADQVDRGCPMVLGGPLPHVMAAKAVALAEARRPDFADYAQRIVDNAQALAEGLLRRGATLVTGGTDNHLVLIDVLRLRPHRPAGRAGAARLGHRHQPQLGPAGPERRLVHLRHPDRHARR